MEKKMETRVAVIAIIIEDGSAAQEVNEFLHGAAQYIIGRWVRPKSSPFNFRALA